MSKNVHRPHYDVIINDTIQETYRSEDRAIAAAERYAADYDEPGAVSVVYQEVSGTYRSSTQIWPRRGDTHCSGH